MSSHLSRKITAGALACAMMLTPTLAFQGIVISDGNLRMRSFTTTDSAILALLPQNTVIEILGQYDEWYQVEHQNKVGYVYAEYVSVVPQVEALPELPEVVETPDQPTRTLLEGQSILSALPSAQSEQAVEQPQDEQAVEQEIEPEIVQEIVPDSEPYNMGYVVDGPLNIRSAPSTDGSVLGKLYAGNWVEILDIEDGWYRIDRGYVSADYVDRYTQSQADEIRESTSSVVDLAMTFLGTPYVYAGSSPSGFDCSGFTQYIFKQYGVSLARTTSGQNANGVFVAKSDLQPGDVLIFQRNGVINHVGIYIGNQKFIHASTPSTGVIISELDSNYYTTAYYSARRML